MLNKSQMLESHLKQIYLRILPFVRMGPYTKFAQYEDIRLALKPVAIAINTVLNGVPLSGQDEEGLEKRAEELKRVGWEGDLYE